MLHRLCPRNRRRSPARRSRGPEVRGAAGPGSGAVWKGRPQSGDTEVDGGLEDLAGAGLQLGSPDQKKSKGGAQGVPFPAPPSEYAPPPNPSAEHLIAGNPFDESAAAYKPAGRPYFGPMYPGFGGHNAFGMPPHLPRVASPYGAPAFPLRHQPPPFAQNPAGATFSKAPAVTFGPPESAAAFGYQPSYSISQALPGPGRPFRPKPGENFGHMPSQNAGPIPPSAGHLWPNLSGPLPPPWRCPSTLTLPGQTATTIR